MLLFFPLKKSRFKSEISNNIFGPYNFFRKCILHRNVIFMICQSQTTFPKIIEYKKVIKTSNNQPKVIPTETMKTEKATHELAKKLRFEEEEEEEDQLQEKWG